MARNHKAAYVRRNQLARQRGFRSYAEQRRYSRAVATESELRRLPETARERRAEALDVIEAARRDRLPVRQAAADRSVSLSAVMWWGEAAFEAPRSNEPRLVPADRLLRARPLVVDGELRIITTRGSNAARKAQQALRLQRANLEGEPGAAKALSKLAGQRVGGHRIETDLHVLDEIGRRGELGDIAEMYRAWLS